MGRDQHSARANGAAHLSCTRLGAGGAEGGRNMCGCQPYDGSSIDCTKMGTTEAEGAWPSRMRASV
jgi:hypothetical protein